VWVCILTQISQIRQIRNLSAKICATRLKDGQVCERNHTQIPNLNPHASPVTCHLSPVTRHLSPVIHYPSPVTYYIVETHTQWPNLCIHIYHCMLCIPPWNRYIRQRYWSIGKYKCCQRTKLTYICYG